MKLTVYRSFGQLDLIGLVAVRVDLMEIVRLLAASLRSPSGAVSLKSLTIEFISFFCVNCGFILFALVAQTVAMFSLYAALAIGQEADLVNGSGRNQLPG